MSLETYHDFFRAGFGPYPSNTSMVLELSGIAAPVSTTINGTTAWAMVVTNEQFGWWGFVVRIESSNAYGEILICKIAF